MLKSAAEHKTLTAQIYQTARIMEFQVCIVKSFHLTLINVKMLSTIFHD